MAGSITALVGTVHNHLSSAITKLGAANRHDTCSVAARMGWI